MLLYGGADTVNGYQLEKVSCCILSSISLKTILNIPECLTLSQSLKLVFWFFVLVYSSSGRIGKLITIGASLIVRRIKLIIAHNCHVGNVNSILLFLCDVGFASNGFLFLI